MFWSTVCEISKPGKTLFMLPSQMPFPPFSFQVATILLPTCVALISYRKKAEIPVYSFAKHARQKETTSIYSPHVLVLEGIFALYDPRVLELLDMKVFCQPTRIRIHTKLWCRSSARQMPIRVSRGEVCTRTTIFSLTDLNLQYCVMFLNEAEI